METIAKEHYRTYEASNEILRPHYFLADQILSFKPYSVFEFGCGTGKNLKLIQKISGIEQIYGVDLSPSNIFFARENNKLDHCLVGDENALEHIESNSFDVVFTCSVLDHIHEISQIIQQFERIARKGIVLFETNDLIEQFYYAHNYESFGFRKLNYSYVSNEAQDGDGATYEIWIYNKGKQ